MPESKVLVGRLTMGRASNGIYYVSLVDDLSGCRVVEIEMTMAEFADAITSRGDTPCRFELSGSSRIGMKREHKIEEVFIPDGPFGSRAKRIRKAIAAFETDGWEGRDSDGDNMHCRTNPNVYKVLFERWVPVEPRKDSSCPI